MTQPLAYTVRLQTPPIDVYRRLRSASGLSPKTLEAAARGLPATLFAVQILCDDEPVGMGRVIGDGGCFYQVVDIAVAPEHQGKGLGKMIMREIVAYLDAEVPARGYVSLIADGLASQLYAQFGFVPTAPASIGMSYEPLR
jgi:GNAT superfamily N-acetyltransferase